MSADVGGKARTLARAARAGLAVPAFCVVSEHACGSGDRGPAEIGCRSAARDRSGDRSALPGRLPSGRPLIGQR